MRKIFSGHFQPSQKEFDEIWKKALFCVDANVMLNLYRYSEETRATLEGLLVSYSSRVHLPHQAAKEFLRHRLRVTATQAEEYQKAIGSVKTLQDNLSKKNRHPFLADIDQNEFSEYSQKLMGLLDTKRKELNDKLTNDEVLKFVENLFDGKTGQPFDSTRLEQIAIEGEQRYLAKTPPGYKDEDKVDQADPLRKFGDLIVWHQVLDVSKNKKKPVVFITDDKKEDWWLTQSGRTIGPRPELVSEFHKETGQLFWMYPVDRFIQEASAKASQELDPAVLEEVKTVSSYRKSLSNRFEETNIEVTQEVISSSTSYQEGKIFVHLNKPMRYATGTAKFDPVIEVAPDIEIAMIACPDGNDEDIKLSTGCGTFHNFNVHIKGKSALLSEGTYAFTYKVFAEKKEQLSIEDSPFAALAALKQKTD